MRVPRRLTPRLVPDGGPFLLPGGPTAFVLAHGYTSFPEEMRPLGEDLAARGATVLGIRLTGHGTHPRDLGRSRGTDWLLDVEDGVALVAAAERVVLLGQSLGSMVMLVAASYLPVAGVVALSPPFDLGPQREAHAGVIAKDVEPHPELGVRREADYPAYAATHMRVEREIPRLHEEMLAAVPRLSVPVLIVSSDGDPWFPSEHGRRLLELVGSERKELVVLERAGHAISRDPARGPAVEAIERFAATL